MEWIFGGFFFVFLIFFGGIIALIVWVIRKSTKPHTKEQTDNQKTKMQGKLMELKSKLVPWGDHTHEDITSAMIYRSKKTLINEINGTVYSPDRKPILAFSRMERGLKADGYMYVSSSDFDLYVDFSVDKFRILYDGQLLGNIESSGTIYNAQKEKIGHAKHPTKVSINRHYYDLFSIGQLLFFYNSNSWFIMSKISALNF